MNNMLTRIMLLLRRARINLINDSGPVQMAQATVSALEVKDNIPRLMEFGFTSNPPAGADVVIGYIGGSQESAVIIASGHQGTRPKGLQVGETMLYCADGKSIYLTAGGGVVVNANSQAVTVNNATTVTINAASSIKLATPTVQVTQNMTVGGNLTVSGVTTTATLDVG